MTRESGSESIRVAEAAGRRSPARGRTRLLIAAASVTRMARAVMTRSIDSDGLDRDSDEDPSHGGGPSFVPFKFLPGDRMIRIRSVGTLRTSEPPNLRTSERPGARPPARCTRAAAAVGPLPRPSQSCGAGPGREA